MKPEEKFALRIRLGMIAASFLIARPFLSQFDGDFSRPPAISFLLIITGFGAFGVVFVRTLQYFNPYAKAWGAKPWWFTDPLVSDDPLQSFHLAGWCSVGMGVGGLVFGADPLHRWTWVLPFGVGVGVLLGVFLVSLLATLRKNR